MIQDEHLGEFHRNRSHYSPGYESTIKVGNGEFYILLETTDPQTAKALAEKARSILGQIDLLKNKALTLLWKELNDKKEDKIPPNDFILDFSASDLAVKDDGFFELHLTPGSDKYFLDGYWPAILFSNEFIPISWSCQA